MSTKHLKTLRVIGEETMQVVEGTTINLDHPATAIADIQLEIRDLTDHIFRNKVIKQGVMYINLIYKGANGCMHHKSAEIPFEEEVEIGGLVPGIKKNGYVKVPVQNPEATLDIQNYIMAINSDAKPVAYREGSHCKDITKSAFTEVLIKVVAEIFVKVSRWEQMDAFVNGRNGVFRFSGVDRPVNNNNN